MPNFALSIAEPRERAEGFRVGQGHRRSVDFLRLTGVGLAAGSFFAIKTYLDVGSITERLIGRMAATAQKIGSSRCDGLARKQSTDSPSRFESIVWRDSGGPPLTA